MPKNNTNTTTSRKQPKLIVRVPEFRDMFICSICKNPFPDTKTKVCNHEFHEQCIKFHLQNVDSSCPICKEPINPKFHLAEYNCIDKSKLYHFQCNYCDFTGDITGRVEK